VGGGTQIVITETPDWNTGRPRRRTTETPNGADMVRITVEESEDGGTNWVTVAEYDAPAVRGKRSYATGAAAVSPYARGFGASSRATCTDAQMQMISDLLSDAVIEGTRCLDKLGQQALADKMLNDFVRRSRQYNCVTGTDYVAAIRSSNAEAIELYVNVAVLPQGQAWEQKGTMFHELLHLSAGGHDPVVEEQSKRLAHVDQVYACEAACFQPNASKLTCAACIKTNVCDDRCDDFVDKTDVSTDTGAMCEVSPTNRQWYESKVECEAGCLTGSCKPTSLDCDQCTTN
jgi:hypothetical protein